MLIFIYSKADFPVYKNTTTQNYEVYSSTSVNGKKLFECDNQIEASEFCLKTFNEKFNK